jgi:hypothetical protein
MYGYGTWSLALRELQQRVFEKNVLRRLRGKE